MGIFSIDKKPIVTEGVDSIIGENAKFRGELTTTGSVNINGDFEGKVEANGDALISRGSKVVGDVKAGNIVVSGQVDGNIIASYALEITESGHVNGDLQGGKIIIEEGSSYCGKVKVASSPQELKKLKDKKVAEIVAQDPISEPEVIEVKEEAPLFQEV